MDEKKMLDRIKKSAEKVDIPDSLKPENIEEKVISSVPKKTGTAFIYKMGGLAAALLVVLIAVWQISRIGILDRPLTDTSVPEDEILDATEAAVDSKDAIAHVKSYEEIYLALAELYKMDAETAAIEEEMVDMLEEAPAEAAREEPEEAMEETGAPTMETEAAVDSVMEDDAELSGSQSADGADKDYSETNIQELGVDEADIIKTDGTYIYILDTLTSRLRIVHADNGEMELTETVELPSLDETVEEMYLDGDTLSLITSGCSTEVEEEQEDVYRMNSNDYTKLYTWNIADRANPKLQGSVIQEGWYRESRKTGNYIYLFTEYMPEITGQQETSQYIPEVEGKELLIDDIFLPETLDSSAYLIITSVDIRTPDEIMDKKAIVSAASMFYVSTKNIYICNNNWSGSTETTQIMKFQYENGKLQAAAAGEVQGYLKDSFCMNEHDGHLRMVTTSWEYVDKEYINTNNLFVLDSNLEICGSLRNLAPDETIQSARFMGDTGYFVTFRQMDPLFSVDLSDPQNPVILGELKITGFSSYLHFYGENKLLGIGEEVDPDTEEYKGVKLSMFDISDPENVTESNKYILKDVYDCPGLYDYKAIMIDPEKNIFGFLANGTYMVFQYDEKNGFTNLFAEKMVEDDYDYYENARGARGIYIGDVLYVSNRKRIRAFDMAKEFTQIGKLEFTD